MNYIIEQPFNTDISSSNIGQYPNNFPNGTEFEIVKAIALSNDYQVIVKTSKGTWYIKGKTGKIDYNELRRKLSGSELIGQKPRSTSWLIKYL